MSAPQQQTPTAQEQQQPSPSFGSVAKSLFSSTFGFKKIPFSILFIVTYAIVALIATPVQVLPPPVLQVYPEKFLQSSWTDLQEISKEFHPYTSHANDRVHDFILKQVRSIASHSSSISTHDDVRSILFEAPDVFNSKLQGRAVYYEGNNVLVKIQGNDTSLGAVLLSAHFDTVPTAYGTTDDGTGIASMLGILRYYADPKTPAPLRSIIFNFNNNEEFGLLGSQAFFSHPWSKEVEVFLNLEGMGAGGRAILFRSTDYGVAKHYKSASSPHVSSIFQQGFTSGFIQSETDYKVYTDHGLRGLDVAFYKPRNLYHTRRDSIRGTTYGALSHMFTNALDVVRSMSSAEKGDFTATADDEAPAVYFDILGTYVVVLPLKLIFQAQVAGIIGGPLLVFGLFLIVLKTKSWHIGIRGWSRGIISLILSGAATIASSKWIQGANELVIMSQFFSPLILLLSIFLLTNYFILGFASYIYPIQDQKLVIFIEIFVILWAALVASTVDISESAATGEYIVTALYYLYFIAITLGLLGLLFTSTDDLTLSKDELKTGVHSDSLDEEANALSEDRQPLLANNANEESYGVNNDEENEYPSGSDNESYNSQVEEEAIAESTVTSRYNNSNSRRIDHSSHSVHDHKTTRDKIRHLASRSLSFDWSLQFLLVVPVGAYLIYGSGLLVFEALRQNAEDGFSLASSVYLELSVLAILLGALVVPFVHRLHALVPVVLLGAIIISGYRTLCLPPLSHSNPMKIKFLQSIDLDDDIPSATVSILTRKGYGYNVVADMPSVKRGALPITCRPYGIDDNEVCSYDGPRPYVIDGATPEEAGDYNRWLNVTVLKNHKDKEPIPPPPFRKQSLDDDTDFGPFTGEIFIEAKDSRVCSLSFNTTIYKSNDYYNASPVRTVTVYHDNIYDSLNPPGNVSFARGNINFNSDAIKPIRDPEVLKYYKGINDLTVHRLNWTQEGYHLSFLWIPRWYENGFQSLEVDGDDVQDEELMKSQNQQFMAFNRKHDDTHDYELLRKERKEQQQAMAQQITQGDGPDKRALGIEVKCYWGEYDAESLIGFKEKSEMDDKKHGYLTNEVGINKENKDATKKEPILVRKIPALDEALLYGPTWVSWTKWTTGLVEVKKYIEL